MLSACSCDSLPSVPSLTFIHTPISYLSSAPSSGTHSADSIIQEGRNVAAKARMGGKKSGGSRGGGKSGGRSAEAAG